MEEVLEGRTEVTNEEMEKLQYTEQVIKMYTHECLSCASTLTTEASVKPPVKDPSNKRHNCKTSQHRKVHSLKFLDE